MPLVSVVIGTYNRADFLRTAIVSVLSQTFQDFEIVVVDDASQDHTCKVIHDFHEKKIRYIKHDVNKGIAAVRNTGLLNSKGKYIGFLDDDDEWLPKKLQLQVELLERRHTKVGAVYTGFLTVNRTTGEIVKQCLPSKVGKMVNNVLVTNWIGTASIPLFRKECFDKVGLFDERLSFGEDWDMYNRISQEFHFELIKEILVKYYVHNKPQLTKNAQNKMASADILLKKYGDIMPMRKTIGRLYTSIGAAYSHNYNNKKGKEVILRGIFLYPYDIRHYGYLLLSLAGSSNYRKLRSLKNQLTQFLIRIGNRIKYVRRQLLRKARYLWWLWRIHYGRDITLNTDDSVTVILSSYNHKRLQNIGSIIRSFLKCRFIDKIIVTNNNPQIDIHDWVKIADPRIQLLNQPIRMPAGYRWFLAKEEPSRYFFAIDDDLFIFPEQFRQLFYRLIQQPEIPHGLGGSIYKPPGATNLDQRPNSYFCQKEMEVDVLHEVYAVTRDHVKTYFELLNKLKAHEGLSRAIFYSVGERVMLAVGDDILISHGGMGRPRIHDFGDFLRCPTTAVKGIALWQGEDFTERRLKILEVIKES